MKTRFFLPIVLTALLLSPVWATPFQPKIDLRRCMVGNQAGLLKVLTPERKVAHTRGIDDRSLARMQESDRVALLQPLGIEPAHYSRVAAQVMRDYPQLPRKEAIALLGALAGSPNLESALGSQVEKFLVQVMLQSPDVFARRQAILALAVLPRVEDATVNQVLGHYETCQNLWETFPVQQFFEYHASTVRQYAHYEQIRQRLAAVPSLYTPALLTYLDS